MFTMLHDSIAFERSLVHCFAVSNEAVCARVLRISF